jgi:hypothetical protein
MTLAEVVRLWLSTHGSLWETCEKPAAGRLASAAGSRSLQGEPLGRRHRCRWVGPAGLGSQRCAPAHSSEREKSSWESVEEAASARALWVSLSHFVAFCHAGARVLLAGEDGFCVVATSFFGRVRTATKSEQKGAWLAFSQPAPRHPGL